MKLIYLFLILSIALIAGCTQSVTDDVNAQNTGNVIEISSSSNQSREDVILILSYNINISSSGFVPNTITIKQGEIATFVNKDSNEHWPASALHPTHTVYPEPGGCLGSKFDACKGLKKDESFSFAFNEKGSWKYHDHLNPNLFGTVNVE